MWVTVATIQCPAPTKPYTSDALNHVIYLMHQSWGGVRAMTRSGTPLSHRCKRLSDVDNVLLFKCASALHTAELFGVASTYCIMASITAVGDLVLVATDIADHGLRHLTRAPVWGGRCRITEGCTHNGYLGNVLQEARTAIQQENDLYTEG